MGFAVRNAVADNAVPAGRINYDINGDVLLLHTVQTVTALDEILRSGRLVPDPQLADPAYSAAYDWMLRQMRLRLPTVGAGAVWFWARTRRRDLVEQCRAARGEVLISCRIPRSRVLLSHFVDWHAALNACFHMPAWADESDVAYSLRWDAAYNQLQGRLEAVKAPRDEISLWPADLRAEVEGTWEGIFDTSAYGRAEIWQATAHAIYADDVIEAVRLI